MTTTLGRKPRVLATRKMMPDVEQRLQRDYEAVLNESDTPPSMAECLKAAEGKDAIVITSFEKFGPEFIPALSPSVRIIATHSVGYDHLSVPQAKARGLALTNTPDVLTDATADISMLLLLGAARGASWGDRMVRENRWGTPTLVSPLGFDVSGKRLGIFGLGRIGQAVARRAKGFGMELHYHSRNPVADDLASGARYHASFEGMLPFCDFLSINSASTPETRGIINERTIALLPPNAIIVNAARGDIVDDAALIAALKSGRLAAAGLDVFKGEPEINPGYRSLENVFLLPHLGSATPGTRSAMGHRALDNLDAFFRGDRPKDLLTGD
ncbi:2-hydroxyacid dehydrogenase [Aestuariivirga sp.]|uniref:2-hydroxyacid dehydrogenase n=1 Tax=Aestuariivirga sp. TaxID=2650926 RepID=UPI0039E466AD